MSTTEEVASMRRSKSRLSDALVFFGASGDLAYKQIFPPLAVLVTEGGLNAPVIGVALAGWSRAHLLERRKDSLVSHDKFRPETWDRLAALLDYVDGDYRDAATFQGLREKLGAA